MKTRAWLITGTLTLSVAAITAWAISANLTFRTAARLFTVTQGTDSVTHLPQYDTATLAGHDLVNLALGTSVDTPRTNEVLALEVNCGSTQASLVVFDKAAKSNLTTIATSTSLDVVTQQGREAAPFPSNERFVARLVVQPGGNATDALLGGFLTIAGRLHLDPKTGCPRDVATNLDKDRLDKTLGDLDFKEDRNDPDFKIKQRAGHAHGVGVLELVSGGATNTVLVQGTQLSIRRQLAP